MKRILTVCLVFAMILAMMACGAPAASTEPEQTTVPGSTTQEAAVFKAGHTAEECKPLARSLGLEGCHQSFRIVWNAENGYSFDAELIAWSFGDVSGIVTEYELFDTAGMFIKDNSPFEQTFIVGYSYPGTGSCIPIAEAFANGGYERDSCLYEAGTLEEMCDIYVDLLNAMHSGAN